MKSYTCHGRYQGDLKTYIQHHRSGDVLRTDAPVDNQGEGKHFSPTDLVAAALGTCIMTILGIKAKSLDLDIEGTRFEVTKTMSSDAPRRIVKLEVHIHMPRASFSLKDKTILEKTAHHCPVSNSLHPDLVEEIVFHWSDE